MLLCAGEAGRIDLSAASRRLARGRNRKDLSHSLLQVEHNCEGRVRVEQLETRKKERYK